MIANWCFLFRPPIPAQNDRDLAKDTRILEESIMISRSDLISVFFCRETEDRRV